MYIISREMTKSVKDPEGLAILEDLAVRNKNPEMDWYLEQSLSMYATESKEKGEAAEVGGQSSSQVFMMGN